MRAATALDTAAVFDEFMERSEKLEVEKMEGQKTPHQKAERLRNFTLLATRFRRVQEAERDTATSDEGEQISDSG